MTTATNNVLPISRSNLHDEVVERLRDMIIEGQLAPGSRVPERELCEQFGVSRTPMREALKVLAWDGLIELLPNRGARVTEVSVDDVDEVFPVMGALEALSGELACQNITEQQLAIIRAHHYQMIVHQHKGELAEYFKCNQQIHETILEAANNETLKRSYHALAGRVRRMRYIANLTPERWQAAIDEHELIVQALDKRDGIALASILKTHLRNKLESVRDFLKAQNPQAE